MNSCQSEDVWAEREISASSWETSTSLKKKKKKNILQHDSYKSLLYHLVWYKDFESLTM